MTWRNVKLILHREIRDQFRDRRTLFMIAVLPMLLYPLLGMAFFQVSQFLQEHPTSIYLIGSENLPDTPQLVMEDRFSPDVYAEPSQSRLFELSLADSSDVASDQQIREFAKEKLDRDNIDAIVYFPRIFRSNCTLTSKELARCRLRRFSLTARRIVLVLLMNESTMCWTAGDRWSSRGRWKTKKSPLLPQNHFA
ncbi:MAG: hypothetical protein R3C28_28290 [Pirellulaceae bacterium]